MTKKQKSEKWFYLLGSVLIAIGIFSKPSKSTSAEYTPKTQPIITYSTPVYSYPPKSKYVPKAAAQNAPQSAEAFLDATPTPEVRRATPVEIRRAEPVIKESNSPSNYISKEVKLTQRITFTVYRQKIPVGIVGVPAGTVVKLIQIKGTNVVVEKDGMREMIPVTSTDLIQRPIETKVP